MISWSLCQNTDVLIMESMFMVSGDEPFASRFTKELSICNHMWSYDGSNIDLFIFDMFEAGTVLRRLHGCVWLKGCNQCRRSIWAIFQWLSCGEFHSTTKIHQPRSTTSKQAHPILGVLVSCAWSEYMICEIPWKFGNWSTPQEVVVQQSRRPRRCLWTPTSGCFLEDLCPERMVYLQVTLNMVDLGLLFKS